MIMPPGPILFLHKGVSPHAVYVVIPDLIKCCVGSGDKVVLMEIKRTNPK